MKKLYFNNKLFLKIGRTPQDPEKSILPAILFINTNHQSFDNDRHRGFVLCVGWWDWSVKIGLFI